MIRDQLSTVQGRWLSPDPVGMAAADLTNPQSLNRYAYVGNNPMNAMDPSGLFPCAPDDEFGLPCPFPGGPGAGGEGPPHTCDLYDDPTQCPFAQIPVVIAAGSGGGGGGGGKSSSGTPAPEPNVNPSGRPLLSGETLGIPNSIHLHIPSILQTLGLVPIAPECAYMFCAYGDENQPTTKYHCDFFSGVCYHTYYDPFPVRLFGTHYCGPGGAGPTLGPLDEACKAHDKCYDDHKLTWQMNFKLWLPHQQAIDLAACNQKLCDAAAANDSEVGATRVRMFFTIVPPTGSQCQ